MRSRGATQRFEQAAGEQISYHVLGFVALRARSSEPRVRNVPSKKFLREEISATQGRHAVFDWQGGGPKIMTSSWIQGLLPELCFWGVRSENFWVRKILRSIGATRRFEQAAGGLKSSQVLGFVALAGRGARKR